MRTSSSNSLKHALALVAVSTLGACGQLMPRAKKSRSFLR